MGSGAARIPALALLALTLAAQGAAAQGAAGPEKQATLHPDALLHPPPDWLVKGQALAYAWRVVEPAGAVLFFSTHIHVGSELVNLTEEVVSSGQGRVVADREGYYSVLWENHGNASVTLAYTLGPETAPARTPLPPLLAAAALGLAALAARKGPAAAVALAALLLAAGAAGAHGSTEEQERTVGPYRVAFLGYQFLTPGEVARFSWAVANATTGESVALEEPRVDVVARDAARKVVNQSRALLQQRVAGFLAGDIGVGPYGTTDLALALPGGLNATFTQKVCRFTDAGQLECPGEAPTPGPGAWLAGLALAGTALAAGAARRRR